MSVTFSIFQFKVFSLQSFLNKLQNEAGYERNTRVSGLGAIKVSPLSYLGISRRNGR